MAENDVPKCQICGCSSGEAGLIPAAVIRPSLFAEIQKAYPNWSSSGFICHRDLNRFRTDFVEALLQAEKGELTVLERDVLAAIEHHELVTAHVDTEYEQNLTLGERLADLVASFGGSWRFIIVFAVLLVIWVTINTLVLASRAFDPYPFILLNLFLSMLAALQAPIIMMSQNRQDAKDRLRSEHDYRVNLKAELEIRNLHEKMDHLLTHQWERLVAIQQVQLEILNELLGKGEKENPK